jgi:C1A family cysteine protease
MVIFGFKMDKSFETLQPNQIWNPVQPTITQNHAVCIIGYDDGKEAFEIVNSYGSHWGTGGFGWLSYAAVKKHGLQVFVLE